jgi:hypothetical protein
MPSEVHDHGSSGHLPVYALPDDYRPTPDHYLGQHQHDGVTYVLYDSCYLVNDGPLQHYDESYDLDNYDSEA